MTAFLTFKPVGSGGGGGTDPVIIDPSIVEATASETILAGTVVSNINGTIRISTRTSRESVQNILGIALINASAGNLIRVRVSGKMVNAEWNFRPGYVFLGADGSLTQDLFPFDEFSAVVGFASDVTELVVLRGDVIEPPNPYAPYFGSYLSSVDGLIQRKAAVSSVTEEERFSQINNLVALNSTGYIDTSLLPELPAPEPVDDPAVLKAVMARCDDTLPAYSIVKIYNNNPGTDLRFQRASVYKSENSGLPTTTPNGYIKEDAVIGQSYLVYPLIGTMPLPYYASLPSGSLVRLFLGQAGRVTATPLTDSTSVLGLQCLGVRSANSIVFAPEPLIFFPSN